jgi:hypothetical protein
MGFKWIMLLTACAVSPLLIQKGAQVLTNRVTLAPTIVIAGPERRVDLRLQPTGLQGLTNLTGRAIETISHPTARIGGEHGISRSGPQPGVYKTTPFASIVIVPAKHLDDQIAVNPQALSPEIDSAMPMLEPELHFIPLDSK